MTPVSGLLRNNATRFRARPKARLAARKLLAFRQRREIAVKALEVTLLSGLRTGEVIGARWNEVDQRN
jgi:integrase